MSTVPLIVNEVKNDDFPPKGLVFEDGAPIMRPIFTSPGVLARDPASKLAPSNGTGC
jgi:hypothetical protein